VSPVKDAIGDALFSGMHYRKYRSKGEWAEQLRRQVATTVVQSRRNEFDAAISHGDWSTAAKLLPLGIDINGFNAHGNTAYISAISRDLPDIAKDLVKNGADPLRTNIWGETADEVHTQRLAKQPVPPEERVRTRRAEFKHRLDRSNTGAELNSLFMKALADEDLVDLADAVLKKGADPHIADGVGVTPLMLASGNASPMLVSKLLDRGTDTLARNVNGSTALHYAASAGRVENIKLLLAHGADPKVADKKGETPRRQAKLQGYADIEELLKTAEAK